MGKKARSTFKRRCFTCPSCNHTWEYACSLHRATQQTCPECVATPVVHLGLVKESGDGQQDQPEIAPVTEKVKEPVEVEKRSYRCVDPHCNYAFDDYDDVDERNCIKCDKRAPETQASVMRRNGELTDAAPVPEGHPTGKVISMRDAGPENRPEGVGDEDDAAIFRQYEQVISDYQKACVEKDREIARLRGREEILIPLVKGAHPTVEFGFDADKEVKP